MWDFEAPERTTTIAASACSPEDEEIKGNDKWMLKKNYDKHLVLFKVKAIYSMKKKNEKEDEN